MVNNYPDFYNDVFGPIMQPFSSAHTAGPCRMGYLTNNLLNDEVKEIIVSMNPDSTWVSTFGLQNEDLAFLSGATGHLPNDKILFQMREYCREHNISYKFMFEGIEGNTHHSGGKITLFGTSGKKVTAISESLGGGLVRLCDVDGYPIDFKGESYMFLLFSGEKQDSEKLVAIKEKFETEVENYGVLQIGTSSNVEGDILLFAEISRNPDELKECFGSLRTEIIKPVTPVIKSDNRKEQVFTTVTEWIAYAKEKGITLAEAAIEYEMASSGWSREEVVAYMQEIVKVKMHRTSQALYKENVIMPESPFSEPRHEYWKQYIANQQSFAGEVVEKVLYYAYAALTPIPGVEFVPGPMGSGGGLIYSVLRAAKEERGYSDEELLAGLFVAAGIGAICFTHSEPGGGNVGCMGEIGMCGAMAAAGVTAMAGGTPEQVEAAASMSMMIAVGWPCDPTSGAKGMPCAARAMQAVTMALVFSDIARSGQDAVFPFHEVLETADRMGRLLPKNCRGSDQGGHCITPTGQKCICAFREWHKKS